MPRPGVTLETREFPPPLSFPTDVGVGFMVGITQSGPAFPGPQDAVHNMTEFVNKWMPSGRAFAAGTKMYDSADGFFNEGGYELYVGRVTGGAALAAEVAIPGGAGDAFTASAVGVGDYANGWLIVVQDNGDDTTIPVGTWRFRVTRADGTILEQSPIFSDKPSALAWAATARYMRLLDDVDPGPPTSGSYALAAGALDLAGVDNGSWAAAFDGLVADLGPGQVSAPGATTDPIHQLLADHGLTHNRNPVPDYPDTAVLPTLHASQAAITDTTGKRSRFSAGFTPWVRISDNRVVPPSGLVMGAIARNDGSGLSPNEPTAGQNGILRSALGLTQTFSGDEREELNEDGINVIRQQYGQIKIYGYRTTADPLTDKRWISFGNSRMHRLVSAQAAEVGERFVLRQIDGKGILLSQLKGALIGEVCLPLFNAGSLFGDTTSEAFSVDVGPTVNTAETLANNEIHAVITLRMSPFGEEVVIEIVKLLVTEEIAA